MGHQPLWYRRKYYFCMFSAKPYLLPATGQAGDLQEAWQAQQKRTSEPPDTHPSSMLHTPCMERGDFSVLFRHHQLGKPLARKASLGCTGQPSPSKPKPYT